MLSQIQLRVYFIGLRLRDATINRRVTLRLAHIQHIGTVNLFVIHRTIAGVSFNHSVAIRDAWL